MVGLVGRGALLRVFLGLLMLVAILIPALRLAAKLAAIAMWVCPVVLTTRVYSEASPRAWLPVAGMDVVLTLGESSLWQLIPGSALSIDRMTRQNRRAFRPAGGYIFW